MYKAFYGLSDNPFSIAPNPHYLFLSDRHREALAHLTYGLGETGGFVLLTGEVGTGKTTVSRCLLGQLPDNTDTAFILNPSLTELELLATLCDELKISYGDNPTLKQLTDHLSRFLLANHSKGRNTVLIIDEAQHLRPEVLEQLRLLTNLETDTKKLLQVILIGQPELQLLLKRQELRQLAQRITARYHLLPLNEDEIALYVLHRLQVAGRFEPLFTRKAVNVLQKYSGGIPRLINLLCERSLMAGYAQSRVPIDHHMVRQAAAEVLGEEEPTQNRYLWPTATAAALCVAFGVSYWLFTDKSVNTAPASNLVTESVPTNVASLNAQTLGGEGVADKSVKPTNQPSGQTSIPDPNQRLLNEAINQSRNIDTAFAGLFSVWGKVPYKGLTACQSAVEQGLACYQQQGNWMSLTRLNYPAVVYLVDDKQQDFYGAVLAVEGEQLLMQLGEQQLWVDRAWFNQHFSGTFEILWQAPNLPMMDISQKSSPGQLQWLENALAHVNGRSPRRVNQFDVQLENDLKTFQSQHGLKADGIAGNQTLVRLNLYLSQQGPRLTDDGARS
ncbi:AAA family ATPase [Shewanella sp. SW36]|uniref:ExeA family protein n=1 Tax=Shewanella TaxID=22 RepID=UPI0021D90827|nr:MULTISPECIES: ExeA family protein [unclassified Shewanella]MCU7974237.1 AAA family ATPase [Shewanella sp. SW36]MCU7989089.1 AAA family ATPase [Shewanella sp. SW1]MCU8015637.1 AAA family ATPase [Shewanella sp. SM72]MCU8050765.1 AAA family ATPase [Shewanella sp. SM43]MCU8083554.1 AAA family ATPase [Shewanella sp. SM23]